MTDNGYSIVETHNKMILSNKDNKDLNDAQSEENSQEKDNVDGQEKLLQKNDSEKADDNDTKKQRYVEEECQQNGGEENQRGKQLHSECRNLNGLDEVKPIYDGRHSPSPSVYSAVSDGPPESPPPLTDPYPPKNLLVFKNVDKKYSCLKCKEILREPVQIRLCGHYLCYLCYEDIWSGPTPRCPEDEAELSDKIPIVDKNFRNEILGLDVKCKNHDEGCEWKGVIQDFVNHVELCEFIKMGCEYDCGAIILKCSRETHIFKDCPKYYIRCPYCQDIILRENKKSHFRECEKLPLPCPNKCDKKTIARNEMDNHIKYRCGRTKIMCKYENIGCTHKTGREKMTDHIITEAVNHVSLLVDLNLKHKGLLNDVLKRVEEHESTITEKNIPRIDELEKTARTQLIWRIDDYNDKIRQAKTGDSNTIFHPPFTTSKHGYRLSASVCLNGDGKAKGSHMSVFISLLKGPYDALLKWPFECRVSFSLLDQNEIPDNRKHIHFSIRPSPCPENDPFLGRPKMEKNASFGCAKFAKHEDIVSRNYIDNDKMFLKIIVDWKRDVVPHL